MISKKFIVLFIIMACSFLTSGCWDYVGINELTLVSGIAIDKKDDNYVITFEIVDSIESNDQTGIKTKLIEYEGKSIFNIIKNVKNIIDKKVYFGNTEIIIVSEDIAKNEGIYYIINTFIKSLEARETIYVVISKEKKASELLNSQKVSNNSLSFELKEIVADDQDLNLTIKKMEFYRIYNELVENKTSLVLPAFVLKEIKNKQTSELDGVAVFKTDKLVGYLTPDESKYFVIAINEVKGGYIGFSPSENEDNLISFEIKESKSKMSYTFKDNIINANIKVKINVIIYEHGNKTSKFSEEDLKELEKKLNENIKKNINEVFIKTQTDFESDIFGIKEIIYRSDYKLYKDLEKEWDNYFKNIKLKVDVDSTIINTRLIR